MSGKAYKSEMEMRKKRHFLNGNFFSFAGIESYSHNLIFWVYKIFSGYTQNYLRPLIIIIISTFIIFPFLYYLFGCFNFQENHVRIYFSQLIFNKIDLSLCGNFWELSFSNTFFFFKIL